MTPTTIHDSRQGYYFGELERDPNVENYPYMLLRACLHYSNPHKVANRVKAK